MSVLIAVLAALLVLVGFVGLPYDQTWFARWGE